MFTYFLLHLIYNYQFFTSCLRLPVSVHIPCGQDCSPLLKVLPKCNSSKKVQPNITLFYGFTFNFTRPSTPSTAPLERHPPQIEKICFRCNSNSHCVKSLVLQYLTRDNTGTYSCQATNTIGRGRSKPRKLDIKFNFSNIREIYFSYFASSFGKYSKYSVNMHSLTYCKAKRQKNILLCGFLTNNNTTLG